MAKFKQREVAIEMRKAGESYSSIQKQVGVSKSTLSLWLREIPLTDVRLRELRDFSAVRIEKTRLTKLLKKQKRRESVLEKVKFDFHAKRDPLFREGFYLYWGEGTKTAEYTVALTSSDPSIIKCFLDWLILLGVNKEDMRVKLHTYSDQNEKIIMKFWSEKLAIKSSQFYKTYVKESQSTRRTYQGMFGHGTCTVLYHDRDMYEYVMSGIYYLRDKYK